MKIIWKYKLEPNSENDIRIDMPVGAEVLDVQVQRDVVCLWALCDISDTYRPSIDDETRYFEIYGTGHQLKNTPKKYIGTFQLKDMWVFHLFEVIEGN